MAKKNQSNSFLKILDFLKTYWFLVPIAGGFIWSFATLPQKVQATEKRVTEVESRQQTIEQYIEATEEQKKLIKKSPPGYRWDEAAEEYVVYREDPRLKKK